MIDPNLIGAGEMAEAYAKVVNVKTLNYNVVGRGERSAKAFSDELGINPFIGGSNNLSNSILINWLPVQL
jgi:hypothetical protein